MSALITNLIIFLKKRKISIPFKSNRQFTYHLLNLHFNVILFITMTFQFCIIM